MYSSLWVLPGYPVQNKICLVTAVCVCTHTAVVCTQRPGRSLVLFWYEERLKTAQKGCFLCEKRLSNAQARGLCGANAGYAPRGWSTDDVTAEANPVSIKWSRCWTVSRKQKRFTMVKGYSKDKQHFTSKSFARRRHLRINSAARFYMSALAR